MRVCVFMHVYVHVCVCGPSAAAKTEPTRGITSQRNPAVYFLPFCYVWLLKSFPVSGDSLYFRAIAVSSCHHYPVTLENVCFIKTESSEN